MASVQAEMQRQRWSLALDAKNAELQRFRSEVDGLLAAARAVQAQQAQGWQPGGQR